MSSPDPPPPAAQVMPSVQMRRVRREEWLAAVRLRVLIGQALEERNLGSPGEIGVALGMPPVEATALLARHRWREGDLALLEAAAGRLGVVSSSDADRRA